MNECEQLALMKNMFAAIGRGIRDYKLSTLNLHYIKYTFPYYYLFLFKLCVYMLHQFFFKQSFTQAQNVLAVVHSRLAFLYIYLKNVFNMTQGYKQL